MKKTLCLVLIALLTALTACPALSEAAADPVVVRVGDVTFTKSQLESAVDTDVTLSEMMTQEYLTDEEKLGQRDETIQRFIGVGLIEMKLRDAGIDFNSIINKYSTDKNGQNLDKGGYPVHPDSKNWPGEFLEAVGKLERSGDTSGPVLTDMGIHILYYASDIPEGAHELTAEERSALNASALYYYQTLELEKQMEDWMDEYEIETHPELLDD